MNRDIEIQLTDITSTVLNFTKPRELIEFINNESTFWITEHEKIKEKNRYPHEAFKFHDIFKALINLTKDWDENLNNLDEKSALSYVNRVKLCAKQTGSQWLLSTHPYTSVFIECHNKHGKEAAVSFINFISKTQAQIPNNYNSITGSIIAYEFLNQNSDILKRRIGEEASLENLRSRLEKTNNKLFVEVENFKQDFYSWDSKNREDWSSWKNQSNSEHSTQQESHNSEFDKNLKNYEARIKDLEILYQEKLRLEKPADYWKKAARRLGLQGGLWSLALLASVLLGVVYFSGFYGDWLKGQEIAAKLNTVQGIIISGTVLATYAFLIRTLSRLTFSSFHLMRDAEEREQLTYLYLSLINENKIDESSRDIVLQALFSRSESGLLSNESGPTMPGISEILRSASKTK